MHIRLNSWLQNPHLKSYSVLIFLKKLILSLQLKKTYKRLVLQNEKKKNLKNVLSVLFPHVDASKIILKIVGCTTITASNQKKQKQLKCSLQLRCASLQVTQPQDAQTFHPSA